jgi:hypothetical protein
MAKKKDNSKYALLALLFGVGGYFIYNKYKKGKDGDTPEGGATEEDVVLAVEQAKQAQSGRSFSNYEIQIMQLQAWLQTGIDGIAGNKTLTKLDYYWANYPKVLDYTKAKADNYPELRKNGYGLLSPSNIAQYIANVNAGVSPRQNYWKSKAGTNTTTTSSSATIARANSIISTWKSSATKSLSFPKGGTYAIYYKDNSGNFTKSTSFFSSTISVRAGQSKQPTTLEMDYKGLLILGFQPIVGNTFYIFVTPSSVTNA